MSKHNGNFEVYGDIVVGANISGSKYILPHDKGDTGEALIMDGGVMIFANPAPYIDIAQTSGGSQLVENVNRLMSAILDTSGSVDNFAELFDTPKPALSVNAHEGEIIIVDPNASAQVQKIAYSGTTISDIFDFTTTTVAEVSGNLQSQIDSISGGSGFTPIAGEGIVITPVASDYSFAVEDYIGKTEVASISAALSQDIVNLDLDLQSQIFAKQNEITLVAGSNVTIVESPTDTWTITSNVSGGGSITVSDGSTTVSNVTTIDFNGATITDNGGGSITVDVSGGGGGISQEFNVAQFTATSSNSGTPTEITLNASLYTSGDILLEGFGKIMIPSNMQNGQSVSFLVTQNASPHDWTLQYETGILFSSGIPTPVSTGSTGTTLITIIKIRNIYLATGLVDFS